MLEKGARIITGKEYAREFAYTHVVGMEGVIQKLAKDYASNHGNVYLVNYRAEGDEYDSFWYIQEADCHVIGTTNNQLSKHLLDKNY